MQSTFRSAILDFFFPPLCHVCRTHIPDAGDIHICDACRELMTPVVSPLCSCCGIPFPGAGVDHICGDCIKSQPHFDSARSALSYTGVSKELIHSFKYNNKPHLRRALALIACRSLTDFVRDFAPDAIVPVPLHKNRLRERRFNQAVLIGEIFTREFGVPLLRNNLRRIRSTPPQITLSAGERRTNVKGAFAVTDTRPFDGRRILLLDDVFTTGSTVDECSRCLKAANAAAVGVVTIARALA